jgi:CheY-like chemotaxis protein
MKRILVVDDDEFVRSMLRATLIDAGYEVLEASNGRDALRVFRECPECIVILDIVMPEMEGIETMQRLRQSNPGVQIIAVSGGGSVDAVEYLRLAETFGASRTLYKPIENKKLLAVLGDLTGDNGQGA